MADSDREGSPCLTCKERSVLLAILLVLISVGALCIYDLTHPDKFRQIPPPSQDAMFTVESTTVNSYNMTKSDSRRLLITVIGLGIRARNPNPTNSCYFFDFREMMVHVKKGDRGVAQADLRDFGLCSGNETLLHVEAVGVEAVGVDDVAEEEGRVMNVSLIGHVGVFGSFLDVTCVDVGVQKVDCDVRMTIPMPDKLPSCYRGYTPNVNYCVLYQSDVQMNRTRIFDPESEFLECTIGTEKKWMRVR